jgi:NAD(P)H-hydrate epimerase
MSRGETEKNLMKQTEYTIKAEQLLGLLPKRQSDANKGTYGKLLVAAGSDGMAGAALLSAAAAYRTGCGLVYVLTPEENRVIIQSQLPEAVYLRRAGDVSERLKDGYSAAVVGPGLSKCPESGALLKTVLETLQIPLVLDADALNLIAQDETLAEAVKHYSGGIIMTPHRGEMARLLRTDIGTLKADPVGTARVLAETFGCVCVAKDARTVVYAPGREVYVCTDGNDGMATGGSGDVLAGIIGGLLAQDGTDLYQTAVLGVYVHARAGDAAAARLGKRFMLARDIIEGMCEVLR